MSIKQYNNFTDKVSDMEDKIVNKKVTAGAVTAVSGWTDCFDGVGIKDVVFAG